MFDCERNVALGKWNYGLVAQRERGTPEFSTLREREAGLGSLHGEERMET